jgi:hypothetical protein
MLEKDIKIYKNIYYIYPSKNLNLNIFKSKKKSYTKLNSCIFKKVPNKKYNSECKIYYIDIKINNDVCILVKNNTKERKCMEIKIMDNKNNLIYLNYYESSGKCKNYIPINEKINKKIKNNVYTILIKIYDISNIYKFTYI